MAASASLSRQEEARPIRVLVVDDSALMRRLIADSLDSLPDINVVGIARDGLEAIAKREELKPDVITLDVEMPRMGGVETLIELMRQGPIPVVMLSSHTQAGAQVTLDCLSHGAVDFVAKSGSVAAVSGAACELPEKIRIAAKSNAGYQKGAARWPASAPKLLRRRPGGVLVIGSSTGGPRALEVLVPAIPADVRVPVVIVQHMPAAFTASLAGRLDRISELHVKEASDGDILEPGVALVAPGGRHLEFDPLGVAHISDGPPVHAVRPSVDVTLFSLERIFGRRTVAVLLTGMGRDGAAGLKAIQDQGGKTLVQDESTCVVFGMPKAAIELGAAQQVVSLGEMAHAIVEALS